MQIQLLARGGALFLGLTHPLSRRRTLPAAFQRRRPIRTVSGARPARGLNVSADPYTDAERAKKKFGKANPIPAGILPVEVFLRNELDQPIRIDLSTIQLTVRPPEGQQAGYRFACRRRSGPDDRASGRCGDSSTRRFPPIGIPSDRRQESGQHGRDPAAARAGRGHGAAEGHDPWFPVFQLEPLNVAGDQCKFVHTRCHDCAV